MDENLTSDLNSNSPETTPVVLPDIPDTQPPADQATTFLPDIPSPETPPPTPAAPVAPTPAEFAIAEEVLTQLQPQSATTAGPEPEISLEVGSLQSEPEANESTTPDPAIPADTEPTPEVAPPETLSPAQPENQTEALNPDATNITAPPTPIAAATTEPPAPAPEAAAPVQLTPIIEDYPGGKDHKNRLTAGLLGIFFGFLGAHQFYLGHTKAGLLRILASFTIIGSLWGEIEGILILLGKKITTDAAGRPLVS